MSRPVVWALVHDFDRTGVPIALERLVRWQRAVRASAADLHVIGGRGGALHSAFAVSAASVTALEPVDGRTAAATLAVGLAGVGQRAGSEAVRGRTVRHRLRHLPRPDVVLVQGAGAWRTFNAVEPVIGSARVVVHLHELETAFGRSGLGADTRRVVERPDRVLAVCGPVAELAVRHGARPGTVELVPGSVDLPLGGDRGAPAPSGRDVVSIGTAGWRKGTDLAAAAALELGRRETGTAWHWVGEPEPSPWRFAVGSPDPLIRHGASATPWRAVPGAVALVVPSREDPLPLVALEAGGRGLPVVASRTGGLPDLLADGRGLLVDRLDVAALAAAVEACLDGPGDAAERAVALRQHVAGTYATEVVGPRWLDALLSRR